jgi:hypothetical protein
MKFVAFTFCILFLVSCKKDNKTNPEGNEIIKGKINLFIEAKHHSWAVPGITVYMKKDATEFPGTDTTLYPYHVQTDASGIAWFKELFIGKYYIYAKGYDYIFGAEVTGKMPIELNSSTVENDEAYYILLVTE